jgi:ADP-heptose:LPS heptosyltransferase
MARILHKLSELSLAKVSVRTPRVLVIRLDYIGDMLSVTPLLGAIRQKFPACYLAVLGTAYNQCVLENNPDVDDFFHYIFSRERERNPRQGLFAYLIDRMRLIRTLRRIKFDYVIIPNGGRYMSSVQFAWQLGAGHVLFNGPDTAFDDWNPEHIATRPMVHEVCAGFRVASSFLGSAIPEKFSMQLHVSQAHQGKFGVQLPTDSDLPIVAINFSASSREEERIWGKANWCRLAVHLAKHNRVVVLGVPSLWTDPDFQHHAADSGLESLRQSGKRVAFLATKDFHELVAAIDECGSLISSDGGPVHIAAARGKPVISLFPNKPEKYKRWYPWVVPHQIVVAQTGIGVMGISVEEVIAAYDKLCSALPVSQGAAEQSLS